VLKIKYGYNLTVIAVLKQQVTGRDRV